MRIRNLIIIAGIFILFFCRIPFNIAQNIKDPNDKLLTKTQAIEEYKILYNSLINYHPVPFMYTGSEVLEDFYNQKINSFPESISVKDFHLDVREFIAQIKCGHAFAKPSNEWYNTIRGNEIFLPFDIFIDKDKAFVRNLIDQEFDFKRGDRLLAINDILVSEILAKMRSVMERDGISNSFVDARILDGFRTYFLFLYGTANETKVKFLSVGEKKEIIVKSTKKGLKLKQLKQLPDSYKVVLENKWSKFAIDNNRKTAYLMIDDFGDRKEFKKYYKDVFTIIKNSNVEELVLDLRNNGGGFFGNGNTLLTYLCREPFDFNFRRSKKKTKKNKFVKRDIWNKLTKFAFNLKPKKNKLDEYKQYTFSYKPQTIAFKGQLKVLINGGTFSQGSLVSAKLHEEGAIFFGEESGGTESGTNSVVNSILTLPYSKIYVKIPYYQIMTYSTKSKFGRGVIPEFELPPLSLNAVSDTQLEFVLKK